MKTKKQLLVLTTIFVAGIFFTSCVHKGEPSQVGELITIEQLKSLPSDDSWNLKSIAVDAYLSHCGFLTKLGKKNIVVITEEPGCKNEKLLDAKILIADANDSSVLLGGQEPRNYFALSKEIRNIEDAEFVLDDYQKVGYQKMRISGTLIYDNGKYYMDNVTLHNIQ